ncbi:sulfotransferase family protein [Rhodovulum marinum]|uniref:Sulfotransferase family protein n=2 Tax=Rhodovulum marinum TaxID=320662 RepID=A0A4R2PUB0_9RHOB|nr:sulfotransferase family protein [Rhodovulum marinum]
MGSHAVNDVFVLYGALRSGTTLVRLLLDAHPDIGCPGERDFMLDHLEQNGADLVLNAGDLELDRIFRASGLPVPDVREGEAAFRTMLAGDRARSGKKVHVLVLHRELGRLRQLCPEARIIHLLRDPRDVARSSIGMGWAGNTWHGIDHWLGTERDWDRLAIPEERVFTLRYEDLLAAPKDQLSRLCAFLGLSYSPAMLDYAQHSTYEAIDPRLAFQWRSKQSPREIAEVEYKLGHLLEARGYRPSGAVVGPPGVIRRARLALQNKLHTWKVRTERYGYVDPVLVMLAGRLRWKSLGRGAQLRIDRKTQGYLK